MTISSSHRLVALAFSLAGSAMLGGCMSATDDSDLADDETVDSPDSIILGNNDLITVSADGSNVPARYRSILDAFGRLLIPGSQPGTVALCTATHVGNNLVVTAGHCFGAPSTRRNNASCAGTSIEWGNRQGKSPTLVSNCTQILAMETNDSRDYAVLRVDRAPAAAVGVDLAGEPAPGTRLTIFSHPGGRPLEWSQTCAVSPEGGDHFGYQCDTQGGSSGASVLRDDTLKVVGIHWGGIGSENSATFIVDSAPDALAGATGGGPSATFFFDANFGGRSAALGLGRHTVGALNGVGNDAVSSLRVPAGLKVTLFEHDNFAGRSKVFTSDSSFVGGDFNDLASSIIVEKQ